MATQEELLLAQPDTAGVEAWYMDDSTEDQRLPHKLNPDKPASLEVLAKLGVVFFKLDADKYETDPKLAAIRKVRGYTRTDLAEISKSAMPTYDEKIKGFFEEHIHATDEVRLILDGSLYFDVRDLEDKWIRVLFTKGDLLVMPAGIYHRFTTDSNDYAKSLQLFVGDSWNREARPQTELADPRSWKNASREKYLATYGSA